MTRQFQFAILVLLLVFASSVFALRAPASAALLDQGGGSPTLNLAAVPKPVNGQPYQFSLCSGGVPAPNASGPCMPTDAALTVGGATPNVAIVFRLQTGSFLPPGFILDGNGVIRGAAGADPKQLKDIKVCAIQVGQIGTNFNCKGQTLKFKNKVEFVRPQTSGAKVAKIAVAAGGAAAAGILAAQALADLEEYSYVDTPTGSQTSAPVTTNPPASNANYRYGNWNCGTSTQCASVFGAATGSVGPFCTLAGCTAWSQSHGGNSTCTAQPVYTRRGFPSGGRACE